jgi:hypothetical protein
MEFLRLQVDKPASSSEASAAVQAFISCGEKLGLQTFEYQLVLSSLILSKLQDSITEEGLQRISATVSNLWSKTVSEAQIVAKTVTKREFFSS